MYTQCPYCLTLFRISSEQLNAAHGQARCCECHQIFSALENLKENPAEIKSPTHDSTLSVHGLDEESHDLPDVFFMEQNDGLESEPDYFTAGSESQMSELLDKESSSLLNSTDSEIISDHKSEVEMDQPFPSIIAMKNGTSPESQGQNPEQFLLDDMFEKQGFSFNGVAWGIGSLLLLSVLALQLAWQNREQLVQYDFGQKLLFQMCQIAGCTPPQHRDTQQIIIEQRDLRTNPDKPGSLILQLQMINHAGFAQPYPRLRIKLFNDEEKVIAERIFEPSEYLSESRTSSHQMPSEIPIAVQMEIVDPGQDVTGFKFEFL